MHTIEREKHVPALLFAAAIGLTPSGRTIDVVSVPAPSAAAPTVLLIGGLDGDPASARAVEREVAKQRRARRPFHLLAIPMANPDRAAMAFPPPGTAYREHAEAHYLWRWIGTRAPDLVLIAGLDAGLGAALAGNAAAGVGRIPARPLEPLDALSLPIAPSEARAELDRRRARTARQVAAQLAPHYGHDLAQAVYIPAVAMIARMRLGETADVERLAAPFRDGTVDSLAKPTGSHLAGHLLFADLARRTGNPAYTALVRKAAGMAMPLHDEMSDAVFMGCPILAAAGKLTSEAKYFDMALSHLRTMQGLCLRADGLYRHSPLNDAAWGRGNAFPVLGLAWTLDWMPESHPAFAEILAAFRRHLAALAPYQNEEGMWREVIDNPAVWPEFSATAMIGAAMLRGVRRGWLEPREYQDRIDRAWRAVSARIAPDGSLIDVCEGTGKQKTAADYLRRAAILGPDPRGGAMAMLFATEMAGLE